MYDKNSRMSFEEPNDPRSGEIINNQIQLTELATYEEQTPDIGNDPSYPYIQRQQNKYVMCNKIERHDGGEYWATV